MGKLSLVSFLTGNLHETSTRVILPPRIKTPKPISSTIAMQVGGGDLSYFIKDMKLADISTPIRHQFP